jgi:ribosomal protein S18 acetylase RimI-like enzyme
LRVSLVDTTLWMERKHLREIPKADVPAGYVVRPYRAGDDEAWTAIQKEADTSNTFTDRTFHEQFPGDESIRNRRIFFAEDRSGHAVGTCAAWYAKDGPAGQVGLIHWVAVRPAHQRRGIGRALLAHALHAMAALHERALLCTDTERPEAVKLYRDFGFVRMNCYRGDIIEESLAHRDILKRLNIDTTRFEQTTPEHRTPWLSQWTLHEVTISEEEAPAVAEELSRSLNRGRHGSWYADFKNDEHHYVIYADKVFCIDRKSREQYEEVRRYGVALGIPEHQLVAYS